MPKDTNVRRHKRRKAKRSPLLIGILAAFGLVVLLTASGFTFAATQEAHDVFCSSCHTIPETTFYQRSTSAQAVDLASFHTAKNTRCIDCHSGTGVFGRMSAEMLGARNALAFYTKTAVQPAPLTRPIADESCLKCHLDVITQKASMNNHFHVFLPRWQASDASATGCVSCHSGHSTGSTTDNRFLDQTATDQVCNACHQVLRQG
jgi:predicted CXXCH cytochrome family protein